MTCFCQRRYACGIAENDPRVHAVAVVGVDFPQVNHGDDQDHTGIEQFQQPRSVKIACHAMKNLRKYFTRDGDHYPTDGALKTFPASRTTCTRARGGFLIFKSSTYYVAGRAERIVALQFILDFGYVRIIAYKAIAA